MAYLAYLLILILVVLIGGPMLVAAILAAAGLAIVAYQALVGILMVGFVLIGGLGYLAYRISEKRHRTKHIFGPLTEEFKQSDSQVWPGILESKGQFIFEVDGQGYKFDTLELARRRQLNMTALARNGGHAVDTKTRRPMVMP